MRKSNVFTIEPGAPFLKTFASALVAGEVVEGFSRELSPLEMAAATIYVPTRRTARALAEDLARELGRAATLLPRILPLGALDETETSLIFDGAALDGPLDSDLPIAASEIWRRMQLAELILQWARALRNAIVSVGADGKYELDAEETFLVASSAADAWHLAGEVARLIDELIIEDVAWEQLDPLAPDFDAYWRITTDFLNIAMTEWPYILAEHGFVDRARRQVLLIEKQSRRLEEGMARGPVIAIGSTGSNRATARLLAAIAHAPQGAVVLPGLDQSLDDKAWALIEEAGYGHPQATLARLLPMLGVRREDVIALGAVTPGLAARGRFVSEALRPADTTDQWTDYSAQITPRELKTALEGIALIEAADEREEALALAICMREVLENPGETAALVTPSRELARRVRAELMRWGVEVDDSGGDPLSRSASGILAQLVIACVMNEMAAQDVVALLALSEVRLGLSRAEIAKRAPLLEIGVLRSAFAARRLDDPAAAIAMARAEARERYAHPAKQRISDAQWHELEDLLRRLGTLFAPLFLGGEHDLKTWIAAHRATLDSIRQGEDATAFGEDREALEDLFDELTQSATPNMRFNAEGYAIFFARVADEMTLSAPRRAHPRLKIFGLLEARLMEADVMLLGGLDETIWPPPARTDAFLNRPMRAALGLTPPERRLGQTAHDFAQALGRPRIVLSRAAKRGGAPTVASRLIQRMAALAGEPWQDCILRGGFYLDLARALDRPSGVAQPLKRPMPKPPLDLRPTRLSVTRIETLRRDPYAIHAEMILGLAELDPLGAVPGASEVGSAFHAALESLCKEFPKGPLPQDARERLCAMLEEGLAAKLEDPDFATFQWPRLMKGVDFYLAYEAKRRTDLAFVEVECVGRLEIPLADGSVFHLSARADRIEHGRDGSMTLVDYKTGTPPGIREIRVGFAPQLTLEAAMVKRGAFGHETQTGLLEGLYLKLGGADGGAETRVDFKKDGVSFEEVAEVHYQGLVSLLNQFRDPATGYASRPFPKFASRFSPYDHLARVREWSIGGTDEDIS
jgi:ATP-dependent helicase/nuclease subunit B